MQWRPVKENILCANYLQEELLLCKLFTRRMHFWSNCLQEEFTAVQTEENTKIKLCNSKKKVLVQTI